MVSRRSRFIAARAMLRLPHCAAHAKLQACATFVAEVVKLDMQVDETGAVEAWNLEIPGLDLRTIPG